MSLAFGAVADDPTCGLELATMRAAAGVPCAFATTPSERLDELASVIGRRTRITDPALAVADIRQTEQGLHGRSARRRWMSCRIATPMAVMAGSPASDRPAQRGMRA